MTIKEAKAYAQRELQDAYKRARKVGCEKTHYIEVLEMAIQALEEKNDLLNRIRTEIEELIVQRPTKDYQLHRNASILNCLMIIDKYTEETTIIKGIETEDGEKLHAKLDEEKNLLIPIPVTYSGKTDVLYMQIPRNIFLEMIKGGE